jgi:hypothetical protein
MPMSDTSGQLDRLMLWIAKRRATKTPTLASDSGVPEKLIVSSVWPMHSAKARIPTSLTPNQPDKFKAFVSGL